MIFQRHQLPEIKSGGETLTALDFIEDWQLSASEIFAWLNL